MKFNGRLKVRININNSENRLVSVFGGTVGRIIEKCGIS